MKLDLQNVPYPLAVLYDRLERSPEVRESIQDHLLVVDILARYCAYVHIAAYFQLPERDPKLNRQIEKVVAANSLFSYFRLGADIAEHLTRHSENRLGAFRDFFRTSNPVPEEDEIDKDAGDEDAAREFDVKNMYALVEFRNRMAHHETIASAANRADWCEKVREFLADKLALPCFTGQTLAACAGGRRVSLAGTSSFEWGGAQTWSNSQLLFCGAGDELPLDPLVIMQRIGSSNAICFLYRQDGQARRYTPIFVGDYGECVVLPGTVKFPWASLVVQRVLPATMYVGEEHGVKLRLTNNSEGTVHVPEIADSLPENLESVEGEPVGRVADVVIPPRKERTVQYKVRGKEAGQRDYPAGQPLTFFHDGQRSEVVVEGDARAQVKTLPPPHVAIERTFLGPDGSPQAVLCHDDELVVRYSVRSLGAKTAEIRISDRVSGARVVSGETRLFEGVLERCGLQEPVQVEYRLHVNGKQRLDIVTEVENCAKTSGQLRGRYPIRDVAPPLLQPRWSGAKAGVGADSRPQLDVVMEVRNVGLSRAYHVSATVQAPPDVTVECQDKETACIGPGKCLSLLFRVALPVGGVQGPAARRSAAFRLQYASAAGEKLEAQLPLSLDRVLHEEIRRIPLIGRLEACRKIENHLAAGGAALLNLHGERGVGKRFLVDALARRYGDAQRQCVRVIEEDCLRVNSVVEAIAKVVEQVVYGDLPVESRGNRAAMRDFLEKIGMPPAEYLQPVEDLEILLNRRQRASEGTWHWVAHLLRLFTKSRGIDRLVLLLTNVDSFAGKELQDLCRLQKEVADLPVRIVASSRRPLTDLGVEAMDVQVSPFSLEECRQYLQAAFIYPPPAEPLVETVYDHSGGIPAELTVLLENLLKEGDRLLSFHHPLGVMVRDPGEFERLPDSLDAVLKRDLLGLDAAPELLGCLVALKEPVSAETLDPLLAQMDVNPGMPRLRTQIHALVERGWLEPVDGNAFRIPRASQRAAIERHLNGGGARLWPRVHGAIYRKFRGENRDLGVCLEHLIEGPPALLQEEQARLIEGLQLLMDRGCYGLLRKCLARSVDKIDPGYSSRLRLCRIEVDWLERAEFDDAAAAELRGLLRGLRPRALRRELLLRLALLESAWRREKGDGPAAALGVLRQCEWRFLGIRRLGVKDANLRFDYDLALWQLYYQSRLEREFVRLDNRLWRGLRRADGRCVVQFLHAFLDLHTRFGSELQRRESLQGSDGPTAVRAAVHPSAIARRTELRRIEESFLASYLREPSRRNLTSQLLLGRLYLTAGLALWRSLTEEQKYADESPPAAAPGAAAAPRGGIHETYLYRAEALFAAIGAEQDRARAGYQIALTHTELLRLAAKRSDRPRLDRLFPLVHGYLRNEAIPRFERLGAVQDGDAAYEKWAECMLHWVRHSREKLPEAIAAIEEVLSRPSIQANPEVHQYFRIELALLYLLHDDWQHAGMALEEIAAASRDIAVLRAHVRLKRLEARQLQVTLEDRDVYEADVSCLEQYLADRSHSVLGHLLCRGEIRVDVRQVLRGLLWHLIQCCIEHEEGTLGLDRLRQWWKLAASGTTVNADERRRAVEALPVLWQLSGANPLQVLKDFRDFALPSLEALGHACLAAVIDRVGHFGAAIEMRLWLAERLCAEGKKADAATVVDAVFQALEARGLSDPDQSVAELVGRALAAILFIERGTSEPPRFPARLRRPRRSSTRRGPPTSTWPSSSSWSPTSNATTRRPRTIGSTSGRWIWPGAETGPGAVPRRPAPHPAVGGPIPSVAGPSRRRRGDAGARMRRPALAEGLPPVGRLSELPPRPDWFARRDGARRCRGGRRTRGRTGPGKCRRSGRRHASRATSPRGGPPALRENRRAPQPADHGFQEFGVGALLRDRSVGVGGSGRHPRRRPYQALPNARRDRRYGGLGTLVDLEEPSRRKKRPRTG